jgi:CHASE3 domain sensor protein
VKVPAFVSAFLAWWNRLPLNVQGTVITVVPFAAILLSTGFAFWGNRQRQAAEMDVTRKFEMVSDLNELLTLTVNAETGVRGFLLTRRSEFLQPYERARTLLPQQLTNLKALAQAEPGLKPRLDKLERVVRMRALTLDQMRLLDILHDRAKQSPSQLYSLLNRSKNVEDSLREEVRGMRREESRLLSERLQEIQSVRTRDYLAIYATLILGVLSRILASWMFNTGMGKRIRQLCENARHLSADSPLPHEPTGRPDALGDLERELAQLATKGSAKPPSPL